MDKDHKLAAPDNESLSTIEQIADHSDLSSIYRKAGPQWEGELLSKEDRAAKKQKEQETMSFGMRPKFWQVGLLAPLPFIILALLLTLNYGLLDVIDGAILVLPMIIVYMLWIIFAFSVYKKLFAMFYKNALRAGPFLIILFLFLGISLYSVYWLSVPFHNQQLLSIVSLMSVVGLLLSIVLSFIQLFIWTTPKIQGNAKVGIITIMALILGFIAATVTFM